MIDQPKRTAPATDAKAARTTFLRESVPRLQGDGRTEDDIAVILGISRFSVRAFDREINPPKVRPPVEKIAKRPDADNAITRGMRGSPWPHRDNELRAHWDAGSSTGEIGRRMNLTKNAIVGRAHRLDLPARPSPIKGRRPPDAPRPVYLPRLPPPTLSTLIEEQAVPPPQDVPETPEPIAARIRGHIGRKPLEGAAGLAVARELAEAPPVEIPKQSLVDILRPTPVPLSSKMGCQFITNEKDGPGWTPIFCDTPRRDGSSYCSDHHKLCHTSYYGQRPPKAPGEADAVDVAEGIPG